MNLTKHNNEWFARWFDTPYYHLLYQHRNTDEAQRFISNIIDFLHPHPTAYFLDVACGKGRHAIYLNRLGFRVDAFDLSPNNIAEAKQSETGTLHFFVNDIRKPLNLNTYDIALNLFTSFGYFDDDSEDIAALQAIAQSLKPNGILVLDFLNVENLSFPENETQKHRFGDITFVTRKKLEDNFVVKDITVMDNNRQFDYQERVKLITQKRFSEYFAQAGFKILHTFGNYNLNPFNPKTSERIIFMAQKTV